MAGPGGPIPAASPVAKVLQCGGSGGRLQQALPLAGATGSWQSGPLSRRTPFPAGDVKLEILSLLRPFSPPAFVPLPWHSLGQFLVFSTLPTSGSPPALSSSEYEIDIPPVSPLVPCTSPIPALRCCHASFCLPLIPTSRKPSEIALAPPCPQHPPHSPCVPSSTSSYGHF